MVINPLAPRRPISAACETLFLETSVDKFPQKLLKNNEIG
jgi:hypothetical protein